MTHEDPKVPWLPPRLKGRVEDFARRLRGGLVPADSQAYGHLRRRRERRSENAEAYRLWSDTYDEENPLTVLDEAAVRILTPELDGLDLLDAACGTGRRLVFRGTHRARRSDRPRLREMLARGRLVPGRPTATSAADVRSLPFPAARFDVAWCRLAAGHLPALAPLYAELARVLRPGACAVVTDFHPEAVRRGTRGSSATHPARPTPSSTSCTSRTTTNRRGAPPGCRSTPAAG
ncbi:MAG: class I SAM-dependent methyltransferase [Acidobacteria bacterium]|nr:class I SAM-dependent methyltransferase [Acidobacteriota bacterium]